MLAYYFEQAELLKTLQQLLDQLLLCEVLFSN